jgi:hypothetical protein
LIGKSGSGTDEIRQVTGAKVDVPNAKDGQDPTDRIEIQIKGSKAQVTQAKKIIEEKRDAFDQTVTRTLEVDKKHHRALIGAGGQYRHLLFGTNPTNFAQVPLYVTLSFKLEVPMADEN